jgi:hypothetical protein
MLRIRSEQMEVFQRDAWRRFEDEMVAHGQSFSPLLSAVIGEAQLRIAVRQAIERAGGYGFTNRGPIRLCVELMFLCGSDFATDPMYPQLGAILREPGDQMQRAERIAARVADYHDRVAGPGGANVRAALQALAALARAGAPKAFSDAGFLPELLAEMHRAFPLRAAYIGERALTMLIREGGAAARAHGFSTPRAEALVVVLMFAFGHGCLADPLYPWISQTLADERIVDAGARAERLERKAVTWLDQVLSRPPSAERA